LAAQLYVPMRPFLKRKQILGVDLPSHNIGTRDGSIIATIITTHVPRNEIPALDHDSPGIRIHAIDIAQPPGIGIAPMADMEPHQAIVSAALAANSSAEVPKKACCEPGEYACVPSFPSRQESAGKSRAPPPQTPPAAPA
jgi:hypothetical protein